MSGKAEIAVVCLALIAAAALTLCAVGLSRANGRIESLTQGVKALQAKQAATDNKLINAYSAMENIAAHVVLVESAEVNEEAWSARVQAWIEANYEWEKKVRDKVNREVLPEKNEPENCR
jgi:hypothetical protein